MAIGPRPHVRLRQPVSHSMQAARVHGVPMRNLVADWNKWSRAESVLAVMGALLLIAVPLRLLMVDRPERRDLHYPTPDQFPKLRSQPLAGATHYSAATARRRRERQASTLHAPAPKAATYR